MKSIILSNLSVDIYTKMRTGQSDAVVVNVRRIQPAVSNTGRFIIKVFSWLMAGDGFSPFIRRVETKIVACLTGDCTDKPFLACMCPLARVKSAATPNKRGREPGDLGDLSLR
jgi:hypothetical protein